MTPKQKAISILKSTMGDDAYRARMSFAGCTPEQMKQQYGESGKTRQEILDGYEKSEAEHQAAIDWAERQPE